MYVRPVREGSGCTSDQCGRGPGVRQTGAGGVRVYVRPVREGSGSRYVHQTSAGGVRVTVRVSDQFTGVVCENC